MRIGRLIPWTVPIGAATAALLASQTIAFAYPTPPATGQLSSGCTNVAPGGSCTFTFQFLDSSGAGSDGESVAFAVHTVPGCGLSPTSATTAGGGFSSTTLSCASNAGTGSETITATARSVVASVTITIGAGSNQGTLPNTSALQTGPSPLLISGVALAAIVLAGGAVILTRGRLGNRRRAA
jgi:hypothetical protein